MRRPSQDSGGCRSGESTRTNSRETLNAIRSPNVAATVGSRAIGPHDSSSQAPASVDMSLSQHDANKDSGVTTHQSGAPQSAGEKAREQRRKLGRAMEGLPEGDSQAPDTSPAPSQSVASGSVGAAHKLALAALQRKLGSNSSAVRL